jgi:23S rRNA (adenine2503-C2)-methyltransferase
MKTNLKQLSEEELLSFMKGLGQKPFRAKQVISWIYRKLATSFDEMTDLSKEFREELKTAAVISSLKLLQRQISEDGTQKFLFELEDGESIESVLIPNSQGKDSFTLCISSQVGCAVGCKFCRTGSMGLKRNLKAYEIADQVIAAKRLVPQTIEEKSAITNIVFMGMGEPFNNFKEVSHALIKLTSLIGLSKRRITVSTSGIIPGIKKLAATGPIANLAVSLNATTDEIRTRIMPINKKYPLKNLLKACREFPLPLNRRITFEYVLLGGLNDSEQDAHRLVKLMKGLKSKINLIPYNSVNDPLGLRPPAEGDMHAFLNVLKKAGMTAIIRKSMGADISAACGQLKAAYKQQ